MIHFETNIFHGKPYKTDFITFDDKEIHYQISTNQQNSSWFIAVTEVFKDGTVKARNDLSIFNRDYNVILKYINDLPGIFKNGKHHLVESQSKQMRDDINFAITKCEDALKYMKFIQEKYCGKE